MFIPNRSSHTSRAYLTFVCPFYICLELISCYISLLQLTVLNKEIRDEQGSSRNKICNFHFRVKENGVEYFYPGSKT